MAAEALNRQVEAGKEDIAVAGEHLSQLKDDAARVASRAAEVGRAGVEAAREKIQEGREAMYDAADRVKVRGQDTLSQVQTSIEQNPLQAVAIAAGVGVLLGLWLRR